MTWTVTSDEAERNTLGAVLISSALFAEVSGYVEAADFAHPAHVAIWRAMARLDADKRPIDLLTTWDQLAADNATDRLTALGGTAYLEDLLCGVVTVENVAYHAKKVGRLAERRRWGMVLRELAASTYAEDIDEEGFFGGAEARVLELLQQRRSTGSLITAKQGLRLVLAEIDDRYEHRDKPVRGVTIGVGDFDRAANGLRASQLMVIAARPSVGKSALMGNVVEHVSRAGMPVLVFSLEMEASELFERMVAAGGTSADRLRTGKLETRDFVQLNRTASDIATANRISVDQSGDLTIAELRSRTRRWRAGDGKGEHALVCVDYLQLVRGSRDKGQKREEEVAEVSRGLKALAKELKCPVIALAQLNREVEKRGNKRPGLSDLRESGQIEQDADIVAFLYREEVSNPDCKPEDKGTAELIIAKGRGMRCGVVRLVFQADHQRFLAASQRGNQ